jgi:hypothetical protein
MDPEKIFYLKNILLIMLSFIAIASYMILSPSGIDLIFEGTSTAATSNTIISTVNMKDQNKVFL